MIHVSEIQKAAPAEFRNELQQKTYEALERYGIPFERVDTDVVITMEDCEAVNRKLDMDMVKTLFLTDRKKQHFYLYITTGSKAFRSKFFDHALGVSRVSFAPSELMEPMLGTSIGAATVFSCLLDSSKDVMIVFDHDVLAQEYYGCSDGTTTGYMKIRTKDITDKLLKSLHRDYRII